MMEGERTGKAKARQPLILWLSTGSILVVLLLLAILLMTMRSFSERLVTQQQDNYTTIVHNISLNIESEVNQTEQALQFFANSGDFKAALASFSTDGFSWPLNRIALNFCVYYSQVIDNMVIAPAEKQKENIWSLKRKDYERVTMVSTNEFADIAVYRTVAKDGEMMLGITVTNEEGYHVTAMLNLGLLYEKVFSNLRSYENADLFVKNSDGVIVMSSEKNVLGRNTTDVYRELAEEKESSPDAIFNILKEQDSKNGGSATFSGFWFGDKEFSPTRKMVIYLPAIVDSGYFIVSVVLEYEGLINFVTSSMVKVSILVLLIFSIVLGILAYLLYTSRHKEEVEKENSYLRELNRTLHLVNEAEHRKNHQQRLEIIGTLTCGIAHEFNNLLTPIMGYSGMLLSQKRKDDPEWDDVKEIFDASEKAKEIIQQISAFGKTNSETAFQRIPLRRFLTQVSKLGAGLTPPLVRFVTKPMEKDGDLFGNATQLTQVVINFILNAVEAIGKKEGQVTLSASLVSGKDYDMIPVLQESPSTTYASISVGDDGCGMDKATKSQIFKPFYTTKEKSGGSGLGLLISENIITAHHGKILVSSEPGKGSTFTILLPLLEKQAQEKTKEVVIKALEGKRPDNLEVLVANNDKVLLRLFSRGLRRRHFQVYGASDGASALELLRHHRYEVLVLDDALRGVEWSSLAMKARQLWPMLTIVLTTGSLEKEMVDAVNNGILDGYVLKPVTVGDLEKEIQEVLKS
jgi:signal transduction histidine kinase